MIDVHAPHGTAHTWRDFFIHIATIVVGLLIAIGLEQSVELFHHRHLANEAREQLRLERTSNQNSNEFNIFATQRHQRDLHRDLAILHAVRNHTALLGGLFILRHPRYLYLEDEWRKIHQSGTINYLHENLQAADYRYENQELILMDIDNRAFDIYVPALETRVRDVAAMQKSRGKKIPLNPPTSAAVPSWLPDPPSWKTAKESGLVVLLPRDEAAMFNLVYAQQDLMTAARDRFFASVEAQLNFEKKFSDDPSGTSQPVLTRMNPADLDQYLGLLIATLNSARRFKNAADLAYLVTLAARDGAQSDEELFRMMGGRPNQTAKPSKSN